jgi:formylglycine-generating enzyme required for sulfatase activity
VGEVAVGSTARVDDVEVGQARLEMRYPGGQTETRTAEVKKGAVTSISFNYVKQPKAIENMVLVEGGTFQMGSEHVETTADARPIHTVTVSSFYVGKYEVTQQEWYQIMNNNPSKNTGDDLPVELVSWLDAVKYCNKLSLSKGLEPCYTITGEQVSCDFTKNGFRLPTEAEWEYAARGGRKSEGFLYSGSDIAEEVAWYYNIWNKPQLPAGEEHSVGKKAANELGIHDMSGNIWEWCWDTYGNYGGNTLINPQGAFSGIYRVIRGGCYSMEWGIMVSDRYRASMEDPFELIGFRVARSAQ